MLKKIMACALLGLLIAQPALAKKNNSSYITLKNASCPGTANTGSSLSYAYSVYNKAGKLRWLGYSGGPTLKIVVTLPSNVTYSSASGSNWTCSYTSPKLSCSYKTTKLSSGSTTSTLTVNANTPATTSSGTTNATATVINGSKTYDSSLSCTTAFANPSPGYINAFDNSGSCAGSALNTKVAGTPFTLSVKALNSARSAVDTTVNTAFAVYLIDYSNVGSGSINASTNCPSSLSLSGSNRPSNAIATASGTFVAGVGTVTLPAVSAAYRKVNVFAINTANINNYGCSTDNFAIRPQDFLVSAQDSDWMNAGTSRLLNNSNASGGNVHAAGEPFTLTVTARDASGNPMVSYSNLGSAYFYDAATDSNITPDVSVDSVVLPSGIAASSVEVAATFDSILGNGQIRATDATFNDAGVFNLKVSDDLFADEDSKNTCSSTVDRNISNTASSTTIGRFIPSLLTITGLNAPKFKTFDADNTSCPSRSFTYIGQPFGYLTPPAFNIKAWAQDADGLYQPTENHRSSGRFGTLNSGTPNSPTSNRPIQYTNSNSQTLDPSLTGIATITDYDGSSASAPLGAALLSIAGSDKLSFSKGTSQVAPFNAAISLSATLSDCTDQGGTGTNSCIPICLDSSDTTDSSGTPPCSTLSSPAKVSFNNIAFDGSTTASLFRYGYLSLPATASAANSSTDIPIILTAKYWNGSAWASNGQDNCSEVSATSIALSGYTKNLAHCETTVTVDGKISNGIAKITLKAPGTGNGGAVDVIPNLGNLNSTNNNAVAPCASGSPTAASPANLPWLQCDTAYLSNCSGTGADKNPKTTATFNGVTQLPNRTRYLYMREMF